MRYGTRSLAPNENQLLALNGYLGINSMKIESSLQINLGLWQKDIIKKKGLTTSRHTFP